MLYCKWKKFLKIRNTSSFIIILLLFPRGFYGILQGCFQWEEKAVTLVRSTSCLKKIQKIRNKKQYFQAREDNAEVQAFPSNATDPYLIPNTICSPNTARVAPEHRSKNIPNTLKFWLCAQRLLLEGDYMGYQRLNPVDHIHGKHPVHYAITPATNSCVLCYKFGVNTLLKSTNEHIDGGGQGGGDFSGRAHAQYVGDLRT